MKLTCKNCTNLNHRFADDWICSFWCMTLSESNDEEPYRKPSAYFCAEHTSGPGVMTKAEFEDKDQVTFA